MRAWPPTCWVVSDGKAGTENQSLGLAEAMGLTPVVKRVRLRKLWRTFSPYLLAGKGMAFSRKGDAFVPPWPDLMIGTGRLSVLPALYVKKMSGGKTFTVQVQHPNVVPLHKFDRLVLPEHDGVKAPNVIPVIGGLHRVSRAMLEEEGRKWAPRFVHLPRPYTVVLLGGSSPVHRFTPREIMRLGPQLAELARNEKTGLLITPSRRTSEMNKTLLRALLHDVPAFIWDEQGDNPYYGMLALADAFIVTCDSVNMISEACATGKPVHVVRLPGAAQKRTAFYQSLLDTGRIRWFDGKLEKWNYEPLREMERAAGLVREAYMASSEVRNVS